MAQRMQLQKAACHTGISAITAECHQKVLCYSLKQVLISGSSHQVGLLLRCHKLPFEAVNIFKNRVIFKEL